MTLPSHPRIAACRRLIAFGAAAALACAPAPPEDPAAEDREPVPRVDSAQETAAEALEQAKLLEQAQAVADDESAPPPARARALRRLASSLIRQSRLREAKARLETAAELVAGEPAELAPTLNALSGALFRLGDFERQEEVLWRALEQAAETSDRRSAATSWNNLGVSFAARGQPSAALAAYHRCLELRQDLDDRRGVASSRHNMGVQLLMLGRVEEGVDELRQAVAARRELDDPAAVGRSLASLAWGLTLDDRPPAALAAYAEALALLEQAEAAHDLAVALEQRAQLHRARGRFAEARTDLERSLDLLEAGGEAKVPDVRLTVAV